MSLPTFKFTKIGAPTNNESVNTGLSSAYKMSKSGLSSIKEKAQETFREMKMPEISLDSSNGIDAASAGEDGERFFSIWTFIKFVLVVIIVWFMWSSLSANGEFHLGMGEFGDKINAFFKTMEEKGREVISRYMNIDLPASSGDVTKDKESESESESDDDDNNHNGAASVKRRKLPASTAMSKGAHRPPVPPDATNSSDKKPGFIQDDTKYTFLDKADRSYTGPAPRADDSTSVTQKHQSGKGGYCYIGEDRGFRSCVRVEASDKCMSGQVYSRHDICIDPTLRE